MIGKHRTDLLVLIALAGGGATVVQAITSFANSQVISVAGQRAITELRRRVEEHVMRLPVSFFDATQSGVLVQRVMTDAEGVRNLVGTGIIQLVGGMVTAAIALGVLFYLNWKLTTATLVLLSIFGGVMSYAFKKLRPIFRERSKIYAEVSGRLVQALGGARVVKVYTAEKREEIVFTKGANRLFRNIASTITGTSAVTAFSTVIVGAIGVLMTIVGGRGVLAGQMTTGDLVMYVFFVGLVTLPGGPDGRRSARRSARRSPASTASATSCRRRPRTPTTPIARRSAPRTATSSSRTSGSSTARTSPSSRA